MIKGLVQGVGFRPFIYRLATHYRLKGEVDNRTNGVLISVEGEEENVLKFRESIPVSAPVASQIKSLEICEKELKGFRNFKIVASRNELNLITEVSPDIAVCDDCIYDLDTDQERIGYPFINCTSCGPRFSITEALPYDRKMTSMKDFSMCRDCEAEYNNVLDRRFHAQPIACNKCGPVYTYRDNLRVARGFDEIVSLVAGRINDGNSVAVKGMGGYNLLCNALDANAVKGLRLRKHRDAKPFAVMFRDLSDIKEYCHVNYSEEEYLVSWRRPVVILRQKKMLAEGVNSGLDTIGAMLPYLPLHYLLFRKIASPAIVLTSGNLSDEPIITDDEDAIKKLMPVTGAVVTSNRQIINRCDDSVVRLIANRPGLIRRSRGFVPAPVDLDCNVDGILALGAEQKNTFCIGRENQAIMSQYIGDLKNLPTLDFFRESIARFRKLFIFNPSLAACDLHPDYLSTSYAGILEQELDIPLVRVQHHHAHIASCMAENGISERVIGICLDGTGFGADGNTWGSEFMTADLKDYTRFAHFDYIPMPGGDKATEEPWRMAISYLYRYFGEDFRYLSIPALSSLEQGKIELVLEMIRKGVNTPLTSGAGRLFDTLSALTGLCTVSTFDSEAPMRLESIADRSVKDHYPYSIGDTIVFESTLSAIIDDLKKTSIPVISARFHNTIARVIADMAGRIRLATSLNRVVLSGGVFQNRCLLENVLVLLGNEGFEIFTNHLVPANDGGISLGQLIVASKMRELCV